MKTRSLKLLVGLPKPAVLRVLGVWQTPSAKRFVVEAALKAEPYMLQNSSEGEVSLKRVLHGHVHNVEGFL